MSLIDVKNEIKNEFRNIYPNKDKIIDIIHKYVSNTFQMVSDDVFELKKYLETQLTKEIKCNYVPLQTKDDYGCDLREIFYGRKGELLEDIEKRQKLINLFNTNVIGKNKCYHILTDIDDTLFAHRVAGIAGDDYSWKEKIPYPGIKEFYKQFYETLFDKNKKYTTILSATPGFAKNSKLKNKSLIDIIGDDFGFIQGEESKIKQGKSLTNWVYSRFDNNDRFEMYGNIKADRCEQYSTLFPEFDLIFIGDNGQGDLDAGKKMIDNNCCKYVFIHKIIDKNGNFKDSIIEEKYQNNIFLFENYLELAVKFKDLKIFNDYNVGEIKTAIVKDIDIKYKITKPMITLIQSIETLIQSIETLTDENHGFPFGGKKTRRRKTKKRKTRRKLKRSNK